jgi:hypothetical protein
VVFEEFGRVIAPVGAEAVSGNPVSWLVTPTVERSLKTMFEG